MDDMYHETTRLSEMMQERTIPVALSIPSFYGASAPLPLPADLDPSTLSYLNVDVAASIASGHDSRDALVRMLQAFNAGCSCTKQRSVARLSPVLRPVDVLGTACEHFALTAAKAPRSEPVMMEPSVIGRVREPDIYSPSGSS